MLRTEMIGFGREEAGLGRGDMGMAFASRV